ncbi:MAG: ArsR family transcriptional regulator [Deltaproteobacteria bacterium]|nr:ArsR family transcriptional regulator [Deltaproteobacteria bacterium]
MLEGLFGSPSAERVLLYLERYGEGYALAISRAFDDMPVSMVQRQLARLEAGGVLASRLQGKTRVFSWNPRFAFRVELSALLQKALALLPAAERERYFAQRTRPRRSGKPR